MKDVKVVIGKNFGDEGKGATVHRLCRGKDAIVVRHNGGAQAGHTVEEDDFRFVFHQLGSGSRAGCPTYWSHTFLPDLLKLGEEVEDFRAEMQRVAASGGIPGIFAAPGCACTIIYDVLLNSLLETLRGSAKHGSCGMGIYEASLRVEQEPYALRLKDFVGAEVTDIVKKLRFIREKYTIPRLQQLKQEYAQDFDKPQVQQWVELIFDENVLWNVATDMWENFRKYVVLADWEDIRKKYDTIIMENAQGLMLDMENEEYFPHLTPSHTGLYNVAQLFAGEKGAYELEVVYVTRTYVTRHGMGRLDYECAKQEINPHMIDKTNVPNVWQDALRYAKHPVGEEFWKYIRGDLQVLGGLSCFAKVTPSICVNHLDETDGKVLFADGAMSKEEFKEFCKEQGIRTVNI